MTHFHMNDECSNKWLQMKNVLEKGQNYNKPVIKYVFFYYSNKAEPGVKSVVAVD